MSAFPSVVPLTTYPGANIPRAPDSSQSCRFGPDGNLTSIIGN